MIFALLAIAISVASITLSLLTLQNIHKAERILDRLEGKA